MSLRQRKVVSTASEDLKIISRATWNGLFFVLYHRHFTCRGCFSGCVLMVLTYDPRFYAMDYVRRKLSLPWNRLTPLVPEKMNILPSVAMVNDKKTINSGAIVDNKVTHLVPLHASVIGNVDPCLSVRSPAALCSMEDSR